MVRVLVVVAASLAVACSDGNGVERSDGGASHEAGPNGVDAGGRGDDAAGASDARIRDAASPPDAGGDAGRQPDARSPLDAATGTDGGGDAAPSAASLWNGVDLAEWEGDPAVWRVEDGAIVGSAPAGAVTENTFLIVRARLFGDFVLRARIWLGAPGNSGIQFRSSRLSPADFRVSGYQADVGEGYWGTLYEERGRGILQSARPECVAAGRYGEWLDYEIEARGALVVQRLGGVDCVTFEERDATRPREGIIALQYHTPGGYEVRFRELTIAD